MYVAFSSSHKFHCHIRKVKNQAPLQQNEVSQIFLNLNVWEVLTIQQTFLQSRLRDVDYDIMMYDSMYRNLFYYQNIFRLMTILVLLYFSQLNSNAIFIHQTIYSSLSKELMNFGYSITSLQKHVTKEFHNDQELAKIITKCH